MITLPFAETTPADRDLQYRVALFVQQHQLTSGSRLTIHARRGVVTLAGSVPTFHQRQLLYSFVRRVAGVVQVQDELDVEWYEDSEPESPRHRTLALQAS